MKFFYSLFNRTPLHIAVAQGHPEVVKLLLSVSKIDPNGKSIFNFVFFNVILTLFFINYIPHLII